ncbi:hypothetical protein JXO52_11270 [bacterium]|nr:hypothetical protein [bacterium]
MTDRPVHLVLCLLTAGVCAAQTASDSPLTDLRITRINSTFSLNGSLAGIGSTASLAGGNVIYTGVDASAVNWNPAALSFLDGRSLILDYTPPVAQDISRYYDVDAEVLSQMESIRDELGTPASTVSGPAVSPSIGFSQGIGGFGVAIPVHLGGFNGGIGFGYRTPLVLDAGLTATGIDAGISSEQDLDGELRTIIMRINANLTGSMNLTLQEYTLAAGWQPFHGLSLGASVSRLTLRATALARMQMDGILAMSGDEYIFNDPYDPSIDFAGGETNALGYTFDSRFQGVGWGGMAGVAIRLGRAFQIGVTVDLPRKITADGMFHSLGYTIPFIDLEGGGDTDELIDPLSIDLSKLTRTEKNERLEEHSLILEQPGAYSAGLALGGRGFTFSLRVTQYSGAFAFDLVGHERRGLSFLYGGGVGLDFTYFFFGASVALVDELVPADGESLNEGEPLRGIPLPKVNLGFRLPTPLGIRIAGIVGLEPAPMLRMSFQYTF